MEILHTIALRPQYCLFFPYDQGRSIEEIGLNWGTNKTRWHYRIGKRKGVTARNPPFVRIILD